MTLIMKGKVENTFQWPVFIPPVIINKLRRIVQDHQNMANKYPCTMCVKSFLSPSKLAIHMLTHTGEKLHKCAQCNKSFSQAAHLKTHLLAHTGVKLHQCAQCDKPFSRAGHLKTHMLTHSGVHLYKCEQCNKAFIWTLNDSHAYPQWGKTPQMCTMQ